MSSILNQPTRRIGSIVASVGIVIAGLVAASPAHAAVGVDLTANRTTIFEDQSVTLSWTSTDAVSLVAGGSWSGTKSGPTGNAVLFPSAGTHTFTLTATDEAGNVATDEVTVVVAEQSAQRLVTVVSTCDAITFTNNTDRDLRIEYLWYDESSEEEGDGDFGLPAGATHRLPRAEPGGTWDVYEGAEWTGVHGFLWEPADCGDGDSAGDDPGHPEVAPVAGR
jgi:hypothetical protein